MAVGDGEEATAEEKPAKPKVRGRGSCKFGTAFGGSGLLSWTNDDPNSAPSKEAANPYRGEKPSDRRPPKPAPHGRGEGERRDEGRKTFLRARSEEGGRYLKRRRKSKEGSPRRRRRSESRQRAPEQKQANKPRTQWVRVINVPTVVQSKHLQHLFKTSLGGVMSCTVDDGIASVCFETPDLAERAVIKYNNGEINGCTISVQPDFTPKQSAKDAVARKTSADQSPQNGKED